MKDDSLYTDYRKAEGGFRYDFIVSEVLVNEDERPINRVFVIFFESKDKSNNFFSDHEYLKVENNYFESSVESTTIIS